MIFKHLVFGIALILMSSTLVNGQARFGIETNIQGSLINTSYRIFANPALTYRVQKWRFGLGPAIQLKTNLGQNDQETPKLSGALAHIDYYPKNNDRLIKFFFSYNLSLLNLRSDWEAVEWNSNELSYQTSPVYSKEFMVENVLAYGFEVPVFSRLLVKTSFGAGIFFSSLNGNRAKSEIDFRSYGNIGYTFQGRFALVYPLLK